MTSSEGKDPDSSDSSKNIYYSYILTCSVDSFGFYFLPSLPLPPSVAVVNSIGTKKSN